MGWKGLGMGIQLGWGTMGRGHNGTGPEWELDTIERGHRNGTDMGVHWSLGTMGRGHNGSKRDGDGDTMWQGHNGTGAQWDEDTIERGHNGTRTL